ncbi:polyprenyl synthetase family protein [Candidatus Paracaedibacter symbiosus]|uniref:polyprenyl synthetase family protein n=1 Tax=Candidatus Paracaedibacter symbiosus TaxID=244582 RepID=UPI00068ABC0F|nr:polyprenyl synthetase family protein [Candidatus Paracaedibacter symbiosus]
MSPNLSNISDNKFSIEDLQSLVKSELIGVDTIIDHSLHSDIQLIEGIAKHIIYAGGKRIRPLLSLISAKIFNTTVPSEALYLATAVEFIHTATLLHDDVVDDSDLRRGLQTAHQIWGNSASILVGDYLFAKAFELMVKTGDLAILDILSQTSAKIAAGEVLQLTHSHSLNIDETIALDIIGAKTAELFAAACQTGALTGGANSEQAKILYQYGYALGMVFQITDDILDYTSAANRGKNLGDDFSEGKITLPLIYAYHKANAHDQKRFTDLLTTADNCEADFKIALDLIQTYGGFDTAYTAAKRFADEALNDLRFITSPLVHPLKNLIEFCLERQA